jgi:hypothetical protein
MKKGEPKKTTLVLPEDHRVEEYASAAMADRAGGFATSTFRQKTGAATSNVISNCRIVP